MLTTFGLILLVAGLAQRLQVSAAIGAFLIGIALSGPIAERTHKLISPLRDLFAAIFFLFFGLQVDPASLPPVLLLAVALGMLSALTKVLTGWWAARGAQIEPRGAVSAGVALIARGEFSIVIAGLGVGAGLEPQLGALSAAYVLFLAVLGPILARLVEPIKR
jgi:CPA2 family monovalent cation:H+ antiporter-2